ncbi:MAG: HlyD family efflux transporter periplasmic adaptor subunit [Bacteroidales bacterium]|nr:HlyD family efflux transporter periplasmic adaptor subunit [Bacteroidales bacterium]
MRKIFTMLFLIIIIFVSCDRNEKSDAYGNFSANEIIISSESTGKILSLNFYEGDEINQGDTIAIIDSELLVLQKDQLLAHKKAISTKFSGILAQVNVLEEQKEVLEIERQRLENLLKDSAISQQKYDNVVGQIAVIDQQIIAAKSGNASIFAELDAIDSGIKLIEEQINRCYIISPIDGIILETYLNCYELAATGKPMLKLADLKNMELTVYVSEDQLASIKIGQQANIIIDNPQNWEPTGTISWISNTAEFTPKIIQTKKERVNLVYAVKLDVENDGSLKIGMPAEVNFVK